MLPPDVLARMIAQVGLDRGMGQAWFDQNFGATSQFKAAGYGPSQWVPGPTGSPVIDPEYISRIIPAIGSTAPVAELVCPKGTYKGIVNGMEACIATPGYVVDPETDLYPPTSRPVEGGPKPTGASVLPAFVGGALGRVQFTQQDHRNISGIRFGVLPRVIFDEVPGGFGSVPGAPTYSDGAGNEVTG